MVSWNPFAVENGNRSLKFPLRWLGPVILLRLTDVDVCDYDAVREVHGVRTSSTKTSFYAVPFGFQSMFSTRELDFHSQRRRLLGLYLT